jgi:hypothetical protein
MSETPHAVVTANELLGGAILMRALGDALRNPNVYGPFRIESTGWATHATVDIRDARHALALLRKLIGPILDGIAVHPKITDDLLPAATAMTRRAGKLNLSDKERARRAEQARRNFAITRAAASEGTA